MEMHTTEYNLICFSDAFRFEVFGIILDITRNLYST